MWNVIDHAKYISISSIVTLFPLVLYLPLLSSFSTGDNSFTETLEFSLSGNLTYNYWLLDLSNLEEISLGKQSFYHLPSFSLSSMQLLFLLKSLKTFLNSLNCPLENYHSIILTHSIYRVISELFNDNRITAIEWNILRKTIII